MKRKNNSKQTKKSDTPEKRTIMTKENPPIRAKPVK